jgi:hypothetical protein
VIVQSTTLWISLAGGVQWWWTMLCGCGVYAYCGYLRCTCNASGDNASGNKREQEKTGEALPPKAGASGMEAEVCGEIGESCSPEKESGPGGG